MGIFKKAYRTFLVSILSVLVVYGTSGISAEKHSCQYCGTDYNIALSSYVGDNPDACCIESDSESELPGHCKMTADSCCSYEVESIGLSEQLPPSAKFENLRQVISIVKTDGLIFFTGAVYVHNNYYPPERPGGRKLVILNSRYLT